MKQQRRRKGKWEEIRKLLSIVAGIGEPDLGEAGLHTYISVSMHLQ